MELAISPEKVVWFTAKAKAQQVEVLRRCDQSGVADTVMLAVDVAADDARITFCWLRMPTDQTVSQQIPNLDRMLDLVQAETSEADRALARRHCWIGAARGWSACPLTSNFFSISTSR